MTIRKHQADIIGWISGLLTIVLLFTSLPDFTTTNTGLWLVTAGLTALMLSFGLSFSQGEISAAHAIGIMAYLTMASSQDIGQPLWAVAAGAFIGIAIRAGQRHQESWLRWFQNLLGTALRTMGQLVLGLAIGGWTYQRLGGDLPLDHLEPGDILPLSAFVTSYLAVYLSLLLVHVRSQQGERFEHVVLHNWQSVLSVLLIPVPIAIVSAVVYHTISDVAFALMSAALAVIATGIHGISHAQFRYEQQVRDLSKLANISNALRTKLDVGGLLQTFYQEIATLMDVRNLAIAVYDQRQRTIRFPLYIRHGVSHPVHEIHEATSFAPQEVPEKLPQYLIAHARDFGILPPMLRQVVWLGVPIRADSQTTGAILLAAEGATRQFTEQDRQFLSTIAAQFSVALDNARLYERSRHRVHRLRTLTRVSAQLSSLLDDQRVLNRILRFGREVVDADAAALFMWWDQAKKSPVLVRYEGLSDDFSNDPAYPAIVDSQDFATRLSPLIVQDLHQHSLDEAMRTVLAREEVGSFAEIPLRNTDEILGILVVYHHAPNAIDAEDAEVLLTYANQAALAIKNAQLYSNKDAALSRRVEQLTLLERLGQELFSSRIQLTDIYELVLKRAAEGTGAHAGVLVLKENKEQPARPVAIVGSPNPAQQVEPLLGITRHVLEHADATLIADTREEPPEFPTLRPQTRSVLSVPILHELSIIGAITLESDTPGCFGNEDMIFVMQVGAQIRIAVDNMNLIRNIESTRDRLQTILDSLKEAILLVDTDGYVRLANPPVASLLDLSPVAILNQPISSLVDEVGLDFAERLGFDANTLRGTSIAMHMGNWEPDGSRSTIQSKIKGNLRTIERTDAPVRDQHGMTIGWLMVFVDVTEEQELARARDDLYSMIIHDLRGPLTAINASLRLINSLAESDDTLKLMINQTTEAASRAVRKLLNLVNSLLDISKMESGNVVLERELQPIHPLVNGVIQELQPLAAEMGVTVENRILSDLPAVDIDADKIERVLLNLLDNAIKFTPSEGTVAIEGCMSQGTNSGGLQLVEIRVTDNGPGVPEPFKTQLFERYVQLEHQGGRRRGTGLGLTFCRMAVEAHQGQIWIEDNPQGGSIFCFTLPVAPPLRPQPPANPTSGDNLAT
ncbi:MAG: GAF domain-containing protein [Chloroflexi bacterium]|nr:GAF domain-containing protein [Chloroflexota bacterium]